MRVLVVSGRADHQFLFDACAYDFEAVLVDSLGADIFDSKTPMDSLAESYDMAVVTGISFHRMYDLARRLVPQIRGRVNGPIVAFCFGGYGYVADASRKPLHRMLRNWPKSFSVFDHLFVGIGDDVDLISDSLGLPTSYVPMAGDVLSVDAKPYTGHGDRPISINAFGRQHPGIMNKVCETLNQAGSDEIVYYTNLVEMGQAKDLGQYRNMFWQLLRKSRISVAFDHLFTTPGKVHSYVGPRWFEALAAGTVVIGKAPTGHDSADLLHWADATIDLSSDSDIAVEEVLALIEDDERLQTASRMNLHHMALEHDWSHRINDMLRVVGLSAPQNLLERRDRLARKAVEMMAAPPTDQELRQSA